MQASIFNISRHGGRFHHCLLTCMFCVLVAAMGRNALAQTGIGGDNPFPGIDIGALQRELGLTPANPTPDQDSRTTVGFPPPSSPPIIGPNETRSSMPLEGSISPVTPGKPISTGNQRAKSLLRQEISVDLRDATLLEALFVIRDLAGINLVVGNEIEGTVNAAFTSTPVEQILETLLVPRGYGFRIVSGSVAVLSLDSIGNRLPSFETAVISLGEQNSQDLTAVVESVLSPEGQVLAIRDSQALMVMDYPERIAEAKQLLQSLERAAAIRSAQVTPTNPGQAASSGATDVPADQAMVRVFQPQYVPAETLSASVQSLLSPQGQIGALESEDKIIVSDVPASIEKIRQALEQLDRPRQQVRIWATIYDCGLEDLKACGINLNSRANGLSMDTSGNPTQAFAIDTVTSALATPANGLMSLTTINDYGQLSAVLQALETAEDTRLLADPNVVVMNHEQANISIVTEVPYQQLTQGIDGGTIGTTEFREAGVTLSVTPHIAQDQTISMLVNPSFSLLTGFTDGDNAPIIDRREAQTTVRIGNLQTLVLGGLRQRTRLSEKSGVPGLSRIPLLGHLFKYRRSTARESELLVFITPEIVTPHYGGNGREICIADSNQQHLRQTPTAPIPFGFEQMRLEEKLERTSINRCKYCGTPGRTADCGCQTHLGTTSSTTEIIGGVGTSYPTSSPASPMMESSGAFPQTPSQSPSESFLQPAEAIRQNALPPSPNLIQPSQPMNIVPDPFGPSR
ncbi:MAG: secretin N-terminal domain-containing protein [Aureliella sp.]